jgi:sphingomyelin phosphodiesterase acid-like 3
MNQRQTQPKTLLALALLAASPLAAQYPAPPRPAPASSTIPALFLSDIHLDPFHDPAKVAKLDAAPAAQWPAILAAPDSPTQPADAAALQAACPTRGIDTPAVLWQSSLQAIRANTSAPAAAHVSFVTFSGDLLAHSFDCKYKTLVPAGTRADYLAFTEKTIRYVVSSLRATLPGVPLYIALGNNDSGCGDYQLDPRNDDFLGRIAPIVAEALAPAVHSSGRTHDAVLHDFAAGGYFSAPLAAIPNTRILILDDVYSSARYATCAKLPDPTPAAAQLAWLDAQLADARAHHQSVWVLGHIPPGVDLYNTAVRQIDVCAQGQPVMFLSSEKLAQTLAAYPGTVRLALFGHTHADEMRLLLPEPAAPSSTSASQPVGIPLKITASITPVNGNNPSFTLAQIDPATATLTDYSVIVASNQTGIATTWSKEYTYSATYHEPSFSASSLAGLIANFDADPSAASAPSQAYLHNYFPGITGTRTAMLTLAWRQYACSMDHDSAQSFAACVCAAAK